MPKWYDESFVVFFIKQNKIKKTSAITNLSITLKGEEYSCNISVRYYRILVRDMKKSKSRADD